MPVTLDRRLAALPHFRQVGEDVLARVADCCRTLTLRAGEDVFREGRPARAFYVVDAGAVRVFRARGDGSEHVLHHFGPGQVFAEAAVFHFGRYPASATAEVTPTGLVEVEAERFLALFAAEPALAPAMIGSLCAQLHALVDRIDTLTTVGAGPRLAHYLLQLPAREADDGLVVELPVSKRTLARELSITPETLSRVLARWRGGGLVAVDGPRVVLRDVVSLSALADAPA